MPTKQLELKKLIAKHEKQLAKCKDLEKYRLLSAKQKAEITALLLKHPQG